MPMPKLSFVTGGARSGKSVLAERLTRLGPAPHHYIATAEAWDDEMRERIARHRADRGAGWITHEAPLDLPAALSAARGTVLIDCATLWLTNQMLGGLDLVAATLGLLAALHKAPGALVIVSNEVGWGIVPENALARAFRDAQGRLNQRLAAQADLAIAVIAGLPMVLKGQMPEGAA